MVLGGPAQSMMITDLRLKCPSILGRSAGCIQRGVEEEGTADISQAMQTIWQGGYTSDFISGL